MDDVQFDKIADEELHHLEKVLGELDPDEAEVELSQGVLTLTFGDGERLIVNSHRAAGEIWMAAFRQAWHFAPKQADGGYQWRTAKDELRATLSALLAKKLGHPVPL
jgi:CyaY protein